MKLVIFDGHGYWVGMRRPGGQPVHFWSPNKKDAARFHFHEVANRIAAMLPQKVELRRG